MAPRISLFTPTNQPKYLPEVYESIKAQGYADWEWVILANGEATVEAVRAKLGNPDDARIRVLPTDDKTAKIGKLKMLACQQAKGDIFLELDHDDLLVPNTLPKVADAYNKGAGFIYSDSAVFENDNVSWGYSEKFGWQHYKIKAYGREYTATRCFPVSPRMLCEVYYAPDHLRAWSREAYFKAGGHDDTLGVGDDHDLICRTYISGAKFSHIGDCGYLYRWHNQNTVKARGRQIQEQTALNRRQHLLPLVAEWCRRNKYNRIDMLAEKGKRWDPRNPAKFLTTTQDGFYGQIMASDVLQFASPDQQLPCIRNLFRLLVPGGFLHITVPSERGRYASQNPKHLTRFNLNSFLPYCLTPFAASTYPEDYAQPGYPRFDLVSNEEFFPDDNFKKYEMLLIRADLCALKGQTHPGPVRI